MISPFESVRIAYQSLHINPLRSLLTTLGIVIGVASFVVMMAIGSGAREQIAQQIESVGSNLIMIVPGSNQKDGAFMGSGSEHTLTVPDAEAVQKECLAVKLVAPIFGQTAQVVLGNKNWSTRVSGVTGDYFDVRGWKIRHGRTFSISEENNASKVCVIGSKVVDALGGDAFPVGMMMRIQNVLFRITGVLESKGQSYAGEDQDDVVFVPLKTAHLKLFGTQFQGEVRLILAQARAPYTVSQALTQVDNLLTR
ncbi:MAG: ABC transporter permease [Desulfomonilaceae bacterium]